MEYKFFEKLPQEAIDIRTIVFVNEQGFLQEFDDIDDRAIHLIFYQDNKPIATARLFKDLDNDDTYIIGRLAVLKEYRGCHFGEKLLEILHEKVKSLGGKKTALSAQCKAQAFYEKMGYVATGEIYLDENCPHIHMENVLG